MTTTELSGTALLQLLIASNCSLTDLPDRLFAAMRIGEKGTKHASLGFNSIENVSGVVNTEFFKNILDDYKKNGIHLEVYLKEGNSCLYYFLNPSNFRVTVIIVSENTSKFKLPNDPVVKLSIIDNSPAFQRVRDNAIAYLENAEKEENETTT